MKNRLVLFVAIFILFSCDKDDSLDNNLQLSLKSCVLDNEYSSAEVKVLKKVGSLSIISSDTDVAIIVT